MAGTRHYFSDASNERPAVVNVNKAAAASALPTALPAFIYERVEPALNPDDRHPPISN